MIKVYTRLLLCALFLVGVSCSDNSTGSDSDTFGEFTMKVTGDFEAERSGQVDFWGMEASSMHWWEISANDFSPQTFSLTLIHYSTDPVDQPGTGSYTISDHVATAPWEDPKPMEFVALYTQIENGNLAGAVEYDTLLCADEYPGGGTLNITSSTSEKVSGNFLFTAHHSDINSETGQCELFGTIQVEGNFEAPQRRF